MNHTNQPSIHVPADDTETRRRAAAAVAKAWTRHPLYWVSLIVFTGFGVYVAQMAWEIRNEELGSGLATLLTFFAGACVAFGIFYLPLAMATTIYRAQDLYYLDTGTARAALATKPDERRDALPGDIQGHSFGAWPRGTRTGKALSERVRDDVHARGGRLTGTALPGMAKTYLKHGMVDDGRIARVLIRVASKPRPDNLTGAVETQQQSHLDATKDTKR